MRFKEQTEAALWGGARIIAADPAWSEAADVYLTPHAEMGAWGVFDAQDAIVPGSVDTWLPERLPLRQVLQSPTRSDLVTERLPVRDTHVYVGRYTEHFGHFLIETLSRLWFLADEPLGGRKLVIQGPGTPQAWFRRDFVGEIFGALDLTPDDFVHVDRPVRADRLILPQPAYGPQDFAHTAFARLCHRIGERLLGGWRPPRRGGVPVYWSKTRLPNGVRHIRNEGAVVDVMEANGVEVLYPETLSMLDKIKLMASRGVVGGTVMSGHHISIFTPGACRFEMLSPDEHLNSNFFLIDRLNGNRSRYYYPEGVHQVTAENPTFLVYHAFDDPRRVALELLHRF